MKNKFILFAALLFLAMGEAVAGDVVVIGSTGMGKLDAVMVQKVFTGKVIEVNGRHVYAVNIRPSALRDRFLRHFLDQDDEKYTAYWTVRRFIGKGVPPRELPGVEEVIEFVRNTPGAIGYIDESEIRPGLNVVAR